MTVPFLCVLIAIVMNYLSKIPVAIAMARAGGYDNRHPREQQARLTGWGRRAVAAHQNGFEAFPIFASCVIVGHLVGSDPRWSALLSVGFLVARVLYVLAYLADLDKLRSLVWGAGLFCSLAIPLLGARS